MNKNSGFSLIEVLVALVIFSIGALGLGKLMMVSVKSNGTAYMRSQATALGYAMLDTMRANRAEALKGTGSGYSVPALTNVAPSGATGLDCSTAACTSQQLALYDLARWYAQILDPHSGLRTGQGSVVVTTAGGEAIVTVTLQWDDSISQNALAEAVTPASVSVTSVL
jgi:type IV pilus assembly protein PilV